MRHTLHQPPRIHKDERGAVLPGELRKAVVDLVPHFVGGHGTKLACRNLDSKVQLAPVTDVDDGG